MSYLRRALTAALTAFALLLLGLFAAPPAHAVGDVVIGTGSGLRGSVALADAGTASITIVVYQVTADGEDWYSWTDAAPGATFEFGSLPAGHYVVRFSSSGYRPQCYGGTTCTQVEVVDGQAAVLNTVTLVRTTPGTLTGKVVGGNGSPLAGATVTATYAGTTRTAQTASTGIWSLTGVASEVGWFLTYTSTGRNAYSEWIYPDEGVTSHVDTVMLTVPGSVKGTVRNAAGVAVAGVDVYLYPQSYGSNLSTRTGATGAYTFTSVIPGRYRLYFMATGHPSGYYPGVEDYSDAGLISVTENGTVTADVKLVDPVTLTGQITDTAGAPLAGYVGLHTDAGERRYDAVGADGQYTFGDLWPGTFTVRASADGHADRWLGGATTQSAATWVAFTSGTHAVSTIALPTRAPITVSGDVRDTDGNPIPDVTVSLDGDYDAVTDPQGAFSVLVPNAGTFDLVVRTDTTSICGWDVPCVPATLKVPEVGAANVHLTVPVLGSLSGVITLPTGVSTDWGEIDLFDSNGNDVVDFEFTAATHYDFPSLPVGTYELAARAEGLATFRASVAIGGAVTKDIALVEGFSVSGSVSNIPAGDELEVVAVDASSGRLVKSEWLESDGPDFVMQNLAPGDYRIGAHYEGHWEWYESGSDPRAATVVHVVDAPVSGVTIAIPTSGRVRISGRIILPTGIAASRASELGFWLESIDTENSYDAVIASDGSFVADVPPGDYRVHVEPDSRLMTARVDEPIEITAAVVHDVKVPLGGMLTGRLVGPDGLPVSDGWVGEVDGDSSEDYVDQWGYWTFGPLAPGAVSVLIEGEGFAATTAGPFTVVAGQTVDTGTQRLAGVGRIPVRIPETLEKSVRVQVTDLAGKELTSEVIDPGETVWIEDVPAGKVIVRFSGGAVTEWWHDAATAATATPLTVTANATTAMLVPDLVAAAEQPKGTITGKITNSTGLVGVLKVDAHYVDQDFVATVNADGTYQMQVREGIYKVRATLCAGYWMGSSGCMGESIRLWYPANGEGDAAWVDVVAGKTTSNINIELGGPTSFLASPKPVISGNAVVDATLTALPGVWVPTADQLTYQWNLAGAPIAAATTASYVLRPSDLGKAVTVTVTGTRAGRLTTTRTSAPTASVAAGTITAGAVAVTGGATIGSKLTAVPGTWLPANTSLAFQWLRNGAKIVGATASTYVVQLADATTKLSVTVTGTLTGYTTKAVTSAQTAAVPVLLLTARPVPTISGTVKIGSTLTAIAGAWAPSPVSLAYQWLRDGVAVSGATGATHVVVGADAGKALSVKVTGSKPGYASVTTVSRATVKVPVGVMTTLTPTIAGTLRVGQTLTASVTGWVPSTAIFGYVWYRSGTVISGATGKTYALTASDLGKTLKVKVTGSSLGWTTAAATSKATSTVAKGLIVAAAPVISGKIAVGQVLSVPVTAWKPTGLSFAYKWYRSGSAISGATGATYKLAAADLGKKISVKVTASRKGYTSVSKTSAATAAVSAGTLVAPVPTITGKAAVGQLLTALPGTWGPAPVTLSYQWLRAGAVISGGRRPPTGSSRATRARRSR